MEPQQRDQAFKRMIRVPDSKNRLRHASTWLMDCSIDSTAKRQARSTSGDGACRCQLDRYREIDEYG